jgi:hypothetical protein
MRLKRREIACADFRIDLLERFSVLASWREVLFDLLVPGELVAACNVRSQFYQILRRQLIDCFFDFRETHTQRLAAAGSIFNFACSIGCAQQELATPELQPMTLLARGLRPYAIAPGICGISAIQRPSFSFSISTANLIAGKKIVENS